MRQQICSKYWLNISVTIHLGKHHAIIDLGTGEYALIGVHNSVDDFIDIMNRDNRVSDLMRKYVEPYEDGESFHSFSGPEVDLNSYL